MEPKIFPLAEPLNTHKGPLTELALKMPRGRAFTRFGTPWVITREGEGDSARINVTFNPKVMFKFVADMSGVDELSLENIMGCDVDPLFWAVFGHVNARPQMSSI